MKLFTTVKFLFVVVFFQFVSLSTFARPVDGIIPGRLIEASEKGVFYSVRPDYRRCASPMCGGYFVSPVNGREMLCPDGTKKHTCYVSSVVFNIKGITEEQEAILKNALHQSAVILKAKINGSVAYGELKIYAAWIAVDENISKPANTQKQENVYAIRNTEIICITAPCPTLEGSLLNTHKSKTFSHLDLTHVNATNEELEQAYKAMDTDDGLLLQGIILQQLSNNLVGITMQANNFYLKLEAENKISKQCFRTGCQSHLCSDESIITTCEHRFEHECYRKATCSRQSNGDCAWEMNNELLDCFNGAAINDNM